MSVQEYKKRYDELLSREKSRGRRFLSKLKKTKEILAALTLIENEAPHIIIDIKGKNNKDIIKELAERQIEIFDALTSNQPIITTDYRPSIDGLLKYDDVVKKHKKVDK